MFNRIKEKAMPQVAVDNTQPGAVAENDTAQLKKQARIHQDDITALDQEIEALVKERTAAKGKLRAITSKIVTLQLREDGANG